MAQPYEARRMQEAVRGEPLDPELAKVDPDLMEAATGYHQDPRWHRNGQISSRGRTPDYPARFRDAQAMRLALMGKTNAEIAAAMGYKTPAIVSAALRRMEARTTNALMIEYHERQRRYRETETIELEHQRAVTSEQIANPGPLTSPTGVVIRGDDGQPLPDEKVRAMAIANATRISTQMGKLWGLEMTKPVQLQIQADEELNAQIRAAIAGLDAMVANAREQGKRDARAAIEDAIDGEVIDDEDLEDDGSRWSAYSSQRPAVEPGGPGPTNEPGAPGST